MISLFGNFFVLVLVIYFEFHFYNALIPQPRVFHLKPSREVGTLKQYLKDAVLDNTVPNEREPLMKLLKQKASEMGLAF